MLNDINVMHVTALFSTLAESNLYRSWKADVIGMTNMPEVKLARKIENRYASVSMVTDFDCWHPDHKNVDFEQVIKVLLGNAEKAKKMIKILLITLKTILLIVFFSSSLFAGVDEPGSGYVNGYTKILKEYERELKIGVRKKKHSLIYVSTSEQNGYAWHVSQFKEINTKAHEKTYKKCMKWAKNTGEDCFLFAIDDEVVWNFDAVVVKKTIYNTDLSELPIIGRALAIVLEEDKKPGRFFEDQPDVNDEYQMHVVYTLYKDSKDKEGDINGKLEELIKLADDWIYKTTKTANQKSNTMNGEGQRIKWDRRKDGKLDISFVRLAITKKEMKKCDNSYGSCGNIYGRTIVNSGFNNPKKIYFNFGDFAFGEWPYSGGFPIFSVFAKHKQYPLKTSEFPYFVLHEALHSMGGLYTCAPNYFEGHNTRKTSDMMSKSGDGTNYTLDPKNDDYWGHNIKTCPDMQDSVYFTPTSDTPFDPFEVTCLTKDKWKLTKHNYEKYMDEEGQCFYSRRAITMPWEKELGIIKNSRGNIDMPWEKALGIFKENMLAVTSDGNTTDFVPTVNERP